MLDIKLCVLDIKLFMLDIKLCILDIKLCVLDIKLCVLDIKLCMCVYCWIVMVQFLMISICYGNLGLSSELLMEIYIDIF